MAAMAKKKLIIETRLNEYEMRDRNRNVPWTAEEIARDATACREAGASIVHFHARTPDGAPAFGYEAYRDAIRAIRAGSDILIHPTLGGPERSASAADRLAHVLRVAETGFRPDIAPMDMGTSNVDRFDDAAGRFVTQDNVYLNTTETLRYFAETLRSLGIKPSLEIWSIPMMRLARAFHRLGLLDEPLMLSLNLIEGGLITAHPGTAKGLRAHLDFLPEDIASEWFVTFFGGNMLPLAGMIIAEGGHIATGIGDYPYPELGQPTNVDITRRIARIAADAGREVATPAEAREMLGLA
jgi:uncharacterized protein (DUF849 family)